jgi:hypothetical protein
LLAENEKIKRRAALISGFEEGLTMVEIGLAIYQGSDLANRNHIAFFTLLSNGFEKLLKIILNLHSIDVNNRPLTESEQRKLGHKIVELKKEVLAKGFSQDYLKRDEAKEDFHFIQNDARLKEIFEILDEFANNERYFYFNILDNPSKFGSNKTVSRWFGLEGGFSDPKWEGSTFESRLALKQENIAEMIKPIEKLLRALSRLLVYGSVGSEGIFLSVFARKFATLEDTRLGKNKYRLDSYPFF